MLLRSCLSPNRYSVGLREDPFMTVQRAFQRTFDEAYRTAPTADKKAALTLRLDAREDEKAFHITADLPGLNENEVEVTFDEGVLTIRGEKKVSRDDTKDTWHMTERSHGSFSRQLSLSTKIDAEKIEAKFEKGVLTLTLPKTEPTKTSAKKIEIKAN